MAIAVAFLLAAAAVRALPRESLEHFLGDWERLLLGINFLALIFCLVASLEPIGRLCRSVDRKSGALLLAILAVALLVRVALPPKTHRLYFDEDIYLNIAQAMASTGKAVMSNYATVEFGEFKCLDGVVNKQPNGFPFLVSVLFCATGASESAAAALTVALSVASILLCFAAGMLLFDTRRGLWAALIYSLIPTSIQWSTTTAAEPAIVFFTALAVACLLLFARERGAPLFAAGIFAALFAAQMRPEGLLVLLLVPPLLAGARQPRAAALVWYACGFLLVPHFIHLGVFRNEDWGSPDGVKFSLRYVPDNLAQNMLYFTSTKRFPLLFSFFSLLFVLLRKEQLRAKGFLSLWLFLAFAPFIPFYAGSYEYGADIRFALLTFVPLSLMAGAGLTALADSLAPSLGRPLAVAALLIAVVFSFGAYIPAIRAVGEESWDARTDHDFIRKAVTDIPDEALVFTHNPCVVLLAGKSALQLGYALDDDFMRSMREEKRPLFVYRDYWTYLSPQKENFAELEKRFKLSQVKSIRRRDRKYALYRLELNGEQAGHGAPSGRSDADTGK